ncbi:Putative non-hem dioxygenase domain, isopenicillin N synthase-like superfamily [Septoria linicola]|uniref:Non-hem dioxygenase domain, isopenicillin N synthase-like superfamily n=1 Tax=Septoria linicola TaxID=215465 RepID=A0A9Q9AL26_9PEZI|nr:putative non-hem dioxygenase domain, isopenicillin N synthase-like superfamily [Septoria linicola]USW51274.1 Putative non-hem dioxygenase domain, isopenicillin N synthase-like superfamily [Septoria linicola]
MLQKTFEESAKFFDRPRVEKDALAWTTPEANRGYSQPGREKVTDAESAEEIEMSEQKKAPISKSQSR